MTDDEARIGGSVSEVSRALRMLRLHGGSLPRETLLGEGPDRGTAERLLDDLVEAGLVRVDGETVLLRDDLGHGRRRPSSRTSEHLRD